MDFYWSFFYMELDSIVIRLYAHLPAMYIRTYSYNSSDIHYRQMALYVYLSLSASLFRPI